MARNLSHRCVGHTSENFRLVSLAPVITIRAVINVDIDMDMDMDMDDVPPFDTRYATWMDRDACGA
jgi:hypothetical protein